MNQAISGIALINGIKLKRAGITSTVTRRSNGELSLKLKEHSKSMRKIQLIGFLALLIFSIIPDPSNTPESTLTTLIIPFALFIVLLRFFPKLRLLNYHGAEHKVVEAYRRNLPLTLDSVKPLSRVTKVCGTMLIVPIISSVLILSVTTLLIKNNIIYFFLTSGVLIHLFHYFLLRGETVAYINLKRILPFFKKERYMIKANILYKQFDAIGYFLQEHFTTKEPSDDELEIAILCMKQLIN